MNKPIIVSGKILDFRDMTVFDITISAANTRVTLFVRPVTNATIYIDWRDGNVQVVNLTNAGGEPITIDHVYGSVGVYKVSITSGSKFDALSCSYISKFNAGYAKKTTKLKYLHVNGVLSSQDLSDYIDNGLKYVLIYMSTVKINLSNLIFDSTCSSIKLYGSCPNMYGKLSLSSNLPNLTDFYFFGQGNPLIGCNSFFDIFKYTPNATFYDIENFALGSVTNQIDIATIVPLLVSRQNTLTGFILLSINSGFTGFGTNLFDLLYRSTSCRAIYINIAGVKTELGTRSEDMSPFPKVLYLTNITGNVSNFNFKYTAITYIYLGFAADATGNINSISNVSQAANSYLTSLTLLLYNSGVSLDLSSISNLKFRVFLANSSTSNITGDISWLGNCYFCNTFVISNLVSSNITGWGNVVDNIYSNKHLFDTIAKSFLCPNTMKNALTGIYQAPLGFVKGSADGTPISHREKIYVLVNNYNWTFTNI